MNAKVIYRRILNSGKRVLRDHGADIFSVLAGIGVVATGITAYNAGKNQLSGESGDNSDSSSKALVIPVCVGTATIGCIYTARKFGKLKEENLLAACSALALYSKRVSDGTMEEDEQTDTRCTEDTGTGDIIFRETFTGRTFKASMEVMEYALRKLQENFSICGIATLNDFYGLIGIEETQSGEVLAWTSDQMVLDPDYIPGRSFRYDEALTQLAIQLQWNEENGCYDIHYNILPIGSLAGIGPCNY